MTNNGVDPAWFYSSVAQSAAAIVALMGGILLPRLDTHIVAMGERRRTLNRLIDQRPQPREQIKSLIEAYFEDVMPWSHIAGWVVSLVLSFGCVVSPLWFLPGFGLGSKYVILALLALSLFGLFFYVAWRFSGLWKTRRKYVEWKGKEL